MFKVNTSIDLISLRESLRDSFTVRDGFVITQAAVAMAVGRWSKDPCTKDPFLHAMARVGSAINGSILSFEGMLLSPEAYSMYRPASNVLLEYLEESGPGPMTHDNWKRRNQRRWRELTEALAKPENYDQLSHAWRKFAAPDSAYPKAELIQAYGYKSLLMPPVIRFRKSVESAAAALSTVQKSISDTFPTVPSEASADADTAGVSVPLLGGGRGGADDAGSAIDTRLFPRTSGVKNASYTGSNPVDEGFKRTPNTSSATPYQSTLPDIENATPLFSHELMIFQMPASPDSICKAETEWHRHGFPL